MGDRGPAAARARQRVGEQRPTGRRAELRRGLGRRLAPGRLALVTSGDDHPSARSGDELAQDAEALRRAGLSRRAQHVWRRVRAAAGVGRQRLVDDERLAQREVEMDDAGATLEGGPVGATGERANPAQPLGARRVRIHLEEPLGGAAVQAELIDRLPGAVLAKLRRAVGGQQQQRDARLVSLDRRRQELGGRRTRRAGDRHRQARGLRQPEREEARAALIDVRVAAQAPIVREREHERRAARSGRGAGGAHPAARQLVHEGSQQQVGVGGRRGHGE